MPLSYIDNIQDIIVHEIQNQRVVGRLYVRGDLIMKIFYQSFLGYLDHVGLSIIILKHEQPLLSYSLSPGLDYYVLHLNVCGDPEVLQKK